MKKKESGLDINWKEFSLPRYISVPERTIEIISICNGDIEVDMFGNKYKEGKGYMMNLLGEYDGLPDKNNHVWIYCNSKPKFADTYPYFWPGVNSKDKPSLVFSEPTEIIYKSFEVDKLIDISLINIIDKTVPGETLFDVEELEDINNSANVYVPIVYETDDFLKQLVKMAIIYKGININKLKSKTGEKYILPNMRAALNGKTKMSVIYFQYWMELLNCDFSITIQNDKYHKNLDKLTNKLVYDSDDGNIVEETEEGETKPIDYSKFKFIKASEEGEIAKVKPTVKKKKE